MEQESKNQKNLQKKIQKRYKKAFRDIKDEFLRNKDELETKDSQMQAQMQAGKITETQYKSWRGKLEMELHKDVRIMSSILGSADKEVVDAINFEIPEEYAEAENHETYEIEKALSISTNYTLLTRESVKNAMQGEFFNDIDKKKNSVWNQRRIRSCITAGVISGQSIPDIANRLQTVVKMNSDSAKRNARTWIGSAVTGGRYEAGVRAAMHGVELTKWWMATGDLRTRISHRAMHKEHRQMDEKFSNGGMFPRDPQLPPAERYNCRCDMLLYPTGLSPNFDGQHWDIGNMTEEEWRAGLDKEKKSGIVNGEDISGTWERNEDKFAFDIEDIVHAQGFDGMPKLVDEKDFDKYLKDNKYLCMRGYRADDKDTLDMYRKALYKGKWYIDCSEGGDAYGKGMYSVCNKDKIYDDYMSKLSTKYGATREFSDGSKWYGNIETFCMDKSSRIISYNDCESLKRKFREGWQEGGEYYNKYSKNLLEERTKGMNLTSQEKNYILSRYMEALPYEEESKVLDWWEDLKRDEKEKYNDKLKGIGYEMLKKARKKSNDYSYLQTSEIAALMGYDGVYVEDMRYLVVLNRTKVIFKRGK